MKNSFLLNSSIINWSEFKNRLFWIVVLQVAGLFYLISALELEFTSGIGNSILYIFLGFLVHSILALRFRMAFFVLFTVLILILKIGLIKGAVLVVLSLATIGICHLPIPMIGRIILVLISFGSLIVLKYKGIASGTLFYIFPIYGSIFMFRSFVYLYATTLEKATGTIWQRLGYFFMLPNLFFFLFPIVDYGTYLNTYYNKQDSQVYQNGIRFLLKGIFYLLIYRFVYYFLIQDVSQINDIIDLTIFIVAGFLMVLRLVGIFHLCIGILCLFGFNLPNTFGDFLLAPNFLELWRRINIYWREFLIKVIYYPLYVNLKKKGLTMNKAIMISSLFTFFMTWQLHSWQFFWISGKFPFTFTDFVYWSFWGVVITYYTYKQSNTTRKRMKANQDTHCFSNSLKLAFNVLGTFLSIALIFSFWTSDSEEEWLIVISKAAYGTFFQYLGLIIGVATILLTGALFHFYLQKGVLKLIFQDSKKNGYKVTLSATVLTVLTVFSLFQLQKNDNYELPTKARAFLKHHYNHSDQMLVERGYYEEMLSPNSFSHFIEKNHIERPTDWIPFDQTEIVTFSNDFMRIQLLPSKEITYKRKPLRTNKWAMSDNELSLEKPENTIRIAILGGSPEMAAGIDSKNRFDHLTEELLNQHFNDSVKIQFLNFSVETYTQIQKMKVLEDKALLFDPDIVLNFIHDQSKGMSVGLLAIAIDKGWDLEYPFFKELVQKEKIDSNMSLKNINVTLQNNLNNILQFSFHKMENTCKLNDIPYYLIYSPYKVESLQMGNSVNFRQILQASDFNLIDLSNLYRNYPKEDIALAKWDDHPNELGNQLLADALFKELIPIITKFRASKLIPTYE